MNPPENRPLEGLKALFACFHERLGDLTTCSATRIDGLATSTNDIHAIEERAKIVVNSLVRAHPLLRSTVRLDEEGARHLVALDDESFWPKLEIEHEKDVSRPAETVENEDETGWQYSLRREHDHRSVHDEALVRFLLHFPAEGNGCVYLILAAHHGLFDGRSLAILAKEFVSGLRRSIAQQGDTDHVPPSLQRSSSLVDLIGESFPESSNVDNSTEFPDANKTYVFDYDDTKLDNPSKVRYLYRKLSDDTVTKLAAKCRSDGVRLTSLIIAAFTGPGLERHLQRPDVKESIGFQCCVDLRRYIDDNDDDSKDKERLLGNLYSIADLAVPVPGGDKCVSKVSLLERSLAIQKELEEQLSDRRFLAGPHSACVDELAKGADELCHKVEAEGYHGRDFYSGVSNLGKLNINDDSVEQGDSDCCSAQAAAKAAIVATEYWFMTRLARFGTYCFFSCNYIPDYGMCIVFTRPDPICSRVSRKEHCQLWRPMLNDFKANNGLDDVIVLTYMYEEFFIENEATDHTSI